MNDTEKREKPYYLFKICILGEGGVGKTCIARRLCFNKFEMDTKLTIGLDFYTYNLPIIVNRKETSVQLTIWDFGGQEQFKKLFNYYITGANGVFLVFSLVTMQTLVKLDWWKEQLGKFNADNVPKVVLGTKSDLLDTVDKQSHVDSLIIDNFLRRYNIETFIKTSSKDDINIIESFKVITKHILDKNKLQYDKIL